MPAKRAQLLVEPMDRPSPREGVCHYDELDEALKNEIGDIQTADGSTVTVDTYTAALVDACKHDVVKFTDYYRIRRV